MRIYVAFFLLVFLHSASSSAQFWRRAEKKKWPKTEGELIHKLLHCLQTKDTAAYYNLFPPFDTLWSMAMRNPDKSPETQNALNNLRQHPQVLVEFDPLYNKDIIGNFGRILSKGEDSGILWASTIMARYELHKQEPTKDLEGLDKIAPERFNGYMFVTDAFNRTIFCITVAEVQKIKGQFFGGQLVNVLAAKNVGEFNRKEELERAYYEWAAAHPDSVLASNAATDSVAASDTDEVYDFLQLSRDEETEDDMMRRQVVERRYYEGLMDNTIPVSLYVRYMKAYPGKPQQFDGLYKLGKGKRYLKLEMRINKQGKWIIEDETAVGTMELVLTGRTYNGFWINAEDYGYDVALKQTGTPKGKIEMMDRIIDKGLPGDVEEARFVEGEKKRIKAEKKQKEKEEKEERKKKRSESRKKKSKSEDKEEDE